MIHTFAITAIASLAAWVGLAMLLPGVNSGWVLGWTVAGSVFIWLGFGNLYLHTERGVMSAVYLGLLSPMLGCLLVGPPWSLVIVFSAPVKSLSLGIITSLLVWITSRQLLRAVE